MRRNTPTTMRIQTALSRRSLLQFTGAGILGVAGASMLSGCGSQSATKPSGAGSVTLPTYVESSTLKPDLPGSSDGIPQGFFNYPKNPVRAFEKPPLDGEKFSAITNIFGPPPRGRNNNPAWQEVEKRLGATVDINAVSADDFATKFNTVIAGDDLPDLMLDDGASVPDIVGFLEAKCQDLTDHLGEDAVKDYPNLAAIPEIIWKQCVKAGKIYELPIPRSMTGGSGFYNATYFADAGVDDTSAISDIDDYYSLLKDLTNPKKNHWALGSTNFGLVPFYHIFKVPNQWQLDGDTLTFYIETDQYLDALSFAAKANKAGMFCPGSEGWTKSQMQDAFISGKVAQIYDGLPAFQGPTGYAKSLPNANPKNRAAAFIPFAADGADPIAWLDNIVFGTVMLKKADDDRVKKVLNLVNFLASPFGTEEYLLLNYGAADVDYKLDSDGNPEPTKAATLDTAVPWKYLGAPQAVVYDPTSKDIVKQLHSAYKQLIPMGIENPCGTLFSPTQARQGSSLTQAVSDAAQSYIAGRKKLDDVKAAVESWRSGGGDKIRDEYQQALAEG